MHKVGLDWDDIDILLARGRQREIEGIEGVPTLLFKTEHGFHLELLYDRNISVKENFAIREKYQDCTQRLKYSKIRHELTGAGHDILFSIKNGHRRRLIG